MWKKVVFLFLIVSLLSALVIGCGGVTPPPSDDLTEPIIPETTKVVEEETIEEIVSVTEDQSTIVFDKSTTQLEELSPGDVIVMGVTDQTPYGLLRKVANITKGGKDGGQVIIETEFASLEEAIEQGSFEFDITLEPEDIEKGIYYPKGVRLIEDKFETGYSFSYELDKVLCNNHLIVDGELSFDYQILFNGTLGFFKLKTLEFKNTIKSKAELDVTLTDSFSVGDLLDDNPKTIFTIPFKSVTVWVSYVPIVLTPQIDINVGLDGEIFAELTTGVTISQEDEGAYVAGVEFDNGTWKEIKDEPVFTFEYREPTLSADAKIKAYAGPQLELMLYGIAGPHCNIYGYLDFEADIWDDPWWALYAGVDVTAGLQLEIITKFWSVVYSSPEFDIINYRTPEPIAQADGPFVENDKKGIITGVINVYWPGVGYVPSAARIDVLDEGMFTVSSFSDGSYSLSNVPVGQYIITVFKHGYVSAQQIINVVEGQTTANVDFNLETIESVDQLGGTYYFGFNLDMTPFNSLKVRQAINYAIDKQTLIDEINAEFSTSKVVAQGPIPPSIIGYNSNFVGYSYNVAKARTLLSQAGYPEGFSTNLYYNISDSGFHYFVAQKIQTDLAQVGIIAELHGVEWTELLGLVDQGGLPFFRMGWIADTPDPTDFLYSLYHSSSISNFVHYNNPTIDSLIEQAWETIEETEFIQLIQQIESTIVDDAPAIYIYHY
jgi:hypothetical protein